MSEFINGTDRLIYILRDAVWFPIGCLIGDTFSESTEMLGTTTRDNPNGWTTSIPTKQSYDLSFNGLMFKEHIGTSKISYYELVVYKRYKQLISWRMDDGIGSYTYGQGYITSLSNSANIDEFISFDCSMVGYGEPLNEELARLLAETGNFVLLETNGKIIL
jgi:hypothetical protein